MRRAAKTDLNQEVVVRALRQAGCSVLSLAAIGKGCPDLLVCAPGWPHSMKLLEVKNGTKTHRARTMTPAQIKFRSEWRGQYTVVTSVDEALAAMGIT